jgi:hypothetical protein
MCDMETNERNEMTSTATVFRVKVHQSGIDALESLLSHDPDLLVHEDDGDVIGPGLITEDEYKALVALLNNLRSPFRQPIGG